MNNPKTRNSNDNNDGYQLEKKLAIKEMEDWIKDAPNEDVNGPLLVIERETFTPKQILREIKKDSKTGKYFVQLLTNHRIEKAKREDEINE